jgi:hypothetical protein
MADTILSKRNATARGNGFVRKMNALNAELYTRGKHGHITREEFKAKIKNAKGKIVRATYYEKESLG